MQDQDDPEPSSSSDSVQASLIFFNSRRMLAAEEFERLVVGRLALSGSASELVVQLLPSDSCNGR